MEIPTMLRQRYIYKFMISASLSAKTKGTATWSASSENNRYPIDLTLLTSTDKRQQLENRKFKIERQGYTMVIMT
ncbi:MAG: hypothetical protein ACX936_13440 [Marinobacter sp.]